MIPDFIKLKIQANHRANMASVKQWDGEQWAGFIFGYPFLVAIALLVISVIIGIIFANTTELLFKDILANLWWPYFLILLLFSHTYEYLYFIIFRDARGDFAKTIREIGFDKIKKKFPLVKINSDKIYAKKSRLKNILERLNKEVEKDKEARRDSDTHLALAISSCKANIDILEQIETRYSEAAKIQDKKLRDFRILFADSKIKRLVERRNMFVDLGDDGIKLNFITTSYEDDIKIEIDKIWKDFNKK